MKHSFEFLVLLLKPFIILGEIQSKGSQNFMLIKIRYPKHRHGSDFLYFYFLFIFFYIEKVFFSISGNKSANGSPLGRENLYISRFFA